MFPRVIPSIVLRSFTLIAATIAIAIPSSAMAITHQVPEGQSLVFIPCEASESSLYKFDSVSGGVSAIGTQPIGSGICYSSAQFNPISGELVAYDSAANDWRPNSLVRIDPTSGEILGRINLVIDEWDDSPDAGVVPLSSESYYMIDSMTYDSLGNLYMFLEDHKMYYASPTQDADTYELKFLIDTPRYALTSASNPVDPGSIYALFEDNDYDVENNRFYKFSISYSGNTPESATMSAAISSDCRYSCFAMAFDESGVAWLQNDRVDVGLNLTGGIYTTEFGSLNPVYTFQTSVPWDYYTVTVVPTEVLTGSGSPESPDVDSELASTGSNSIFPFEIASIFLILGFCLLLANRARRNIF